MPILPGNIRETKEITENGQYDVERYYTANVNVQSTFDTLNITPTTSAQSFTPTSGIDGYNEVNVSAVDNTIDNNIQASNIKLGTTILGISGSVIESNETTLNITPSTSAQTLTPTSPYTGYNQVNVNAVTNSIDSNITAENIKKDVTILGITGNYYGIQPSGTLNISNNGIYNVTNYAEVDVQTSVPTYYVDKKVATKSVYDPDQGWINAKVLCNKSASLTLPADVYSIADFCFMGAWANTDEAMTVPDFSHIKHLGYGVFNRAFYQAQNVTGPVNFNSLITINEYNSYPKCFEYAFSYTKISSANFGSLRSVSGSQTFSYAFSYISTPFTADFHSLTAIYSDSFREAFTSCSGLTSVDFSSLQTIESNYGNPVNAMFAYVNSLVELSFPSLETATITGWSGNCLGWLVCGSTSLKKLLLPKLKYVGKADNSIVSEKLMPYMIYDCPALEEIDLRSLETVNCSNDAFWYAFHGNTGLTTMKFQSLKTAFGYKYFDYTFNNDTSLQNVYFYALDSNSFSGYNYTNQFDTMLNGCDGVTVHFPMRIQSTIGAWAGVVSGMSGTNTTVTFDIVTTLTGADTNSYIRQEKDSTSTATAWNLNDTLYYTAGTTEPQVGDTIYSDDECTTAVTTINSIA